jgi:hypothetical protein
MAYGEIDDASAERLLNVVRSWKRRENNHHRLPLFKQ